MTPIYFDEEDFLADAATCRELERDVEQFERPAKERYHTAQRFRRQSAGANTSGSHRRRNKRSYV